MKKNLVKQVAQAMTISLLAVTSFVANVQADQVSVPNTFTSGTAADANEVNDNFQALVTESNAQDNRINTLEGKTIGLENCAWTACIDTGGTLAICPTNKILAGIDAAFQDSQDPVGCGSTSAASDDVRLYCCSMVLQ